MDIKNIFKSKYIKYGYLLLVIPVFFLVRYYYFNDPEIGTSQGLFPRCPFHAITGYHCPGCGSQRAIHDILHLRILDAIQHNLLIVVIALLLASKIYSQLAKKYFPTYDFYLGHNTYFTYGLIIITFLYWILRNIPSAPFHYLAP